MIYSTKLYYTILHFTNTILILYYNMVLSALGAAPDSPGGPLSYDNDNNNHNNTNANNNDNDT